MVNAKLGATWREKKKTFQLLLPQTFQLSTLPLENRASNRQEFILWFFTWNSPEVVEGRQSEPDLFRWLAPSFKIFLFWFILFEDEETIREEAELVFFKIFLALVTVVICIRKSTIWMMTQNQNFRFRFNSLLFQSKQIFS